MAPGTRVTLHTLVLMQVAVPSSKCPLSLKQPDEGSHLNPTPGYCTLQPAQARSV